MRTMRRVTVHKFMFLHFLSKYFVKLNFETKVDGNTFYMLDLIV